MRHTFIFFWLWVWASLVTAISPEMQARIESFIPLVDQAMRELQGGAVAIVYHDEVVWQKTYGHTREGQGQITPKTLFSLGSLSKAVVATALMRWVEDGRLNLHMPISPHLPLMPPNVTLEHLLSHTTGYNFHGNVLIEQGKPRAELLDHLFQSRHEHRPGTSFRYCNTNFSLVEEVVDHVTGQPWHHTVKELWEALGQQDVSFCDVPEHMDVAWTHVRENVVGKKGINKGPTSMAQKPQKKSSNQRDACLTTGRVPPQNYISTTCASAGLFASLEAMSAFLKLHLGAHPEVLPHAARTRMYHPRAKVADIFRWNINWPVSPKQVLSDYALGWRSIELTQQPKTRLIFHGGWLRGVNTFLGFVPDQNIGIVILANEMSRAPMDLGIAFWHTVIK